MIEVVGFGTGVGKWDTKTSEFWSLVSPQGGSPSETDFECLTPPTPTTRCTDNVYKAGAMMQQINQLSPDRLFYLSQNSLPQPNQFV